MVVFSMRRTIGQRSERYIMVMLSMRQELRTAGPHGIASVFGQQDDRTSLWTTGRLYIARKIGSRQCRATTWALLQGVCHVSNCCITIVISIIFLLPLIDPIDLRQSYERLLTSQYDRLSVDCYEIHVRTRDNTRDQTVVWLTCKLLQSPLEHQIAHNM
jgi:hypothetical protein